MKKSLSLQSKIYSREQLVNILEEFRLKGKQIGLTNGAFDILHAGHVRYLEEAKNLCDILVVSVNTDASVKEYKGDNRPITLQEDRAAVIAALQSVDYVTFHPERRMRTTLELLQPKFYIKGGDYNPDSLTSKDVLEKWGGEVKFIPFVKGKSTTNIIEKIVSVYGNMPTSLPLTSGGKKKAVFLDRDGVINEETEYLHDPDKFKLLPGVIKGLQEVQKMGYLLVIVTNQAGIGLGYFTEEDFYRVNKKMLAEFHKNNITIAKIYYCPHSISDCCDCRKPKTGLFERAKKDLNIDFTKSFMIGDKTSDIMAGKSIASKTIQITNGHVEKSEQQSSREEFVANNLEEAARIIQQYP